MHEFEEYVSAFVDKQYAGLTDRDVELLQRALNRHPELRGKFHLDLATKICLSRHALSAQCPEVTVDTIRGYIYHIYKIRLASLAARK